MNSRYCGRSMPSCSFQRSKGTSVPAHLGSRAREASWYFLVTSVGQVAGTLLGEMAGAWREKHCQDEITINQVGASLSRLARHICQIGI